MPVERGSAVQVGIHLSCKNCSQKAVCGLISATASGFHQCHLLLHARCRYPSSLASRFSHTEHRCVCHRDCKEQRMGRKVGTLIPLVHFLSPYWLFQLPPVGAGGRPTPPHTPQCPSSQLSPAVPLLLVASLSHCLEKQQLVRTGLSPVSQESPLRQAPFPY